MLTLDQIARVFITYFLIEDFTSADNLYSKYSLISFKFTVCTKWYVNISLHIMTTR